MTFQTTHILTAEAIGHHLQPTTQITLPEQRFTLCPVIHPINFVGDPASRTFWSAEANARYIVRAGGADIFGQTPDWTAKQANLGEHGRRAPLGKNCAIPPGFELWRAADEAARHERGDAPVAWHIIGWLDQDRSETDWCFKVTEFIDRNLVAQGMTADWQSTVRRTRRAAAGPNLTSILSPPLASMLVPGSASRSPTGSPRARCVMRSRMLGEQAGGCATVSGSRF